MKKTTQTMLIAATLVTAMTCTGCDTSKETDKAYSNVVNDASLGVQGAYGVKGFTKDYFRQAENEQAETDEVEETEKSE